MELIQRMVKYAPGMHRIGLRDNEKKDKHRLIINLDRYKTEENNLTYKKYLFLVSLGIFNHAY
jgi:hypothetical protein